MVVHGFATGSFAEALGALTKAEVIDAFLRQLATVLPGADLPSLRGALCHAQARTLARATSAGVLGQVGKLHRAQGYLCWGRRPPRAESAAEGAL